jgi:hypothetical protein
VKQDGVGVHGEDCVALPYVKHNAVGVPEEEGIKMLRLRPT